MTKAYRDSQKRISYLYKAKIFSTCGLHGSSFYLEDVIDQSIGPIRWSVFSSIGKPIWDRWEVSPSLGQLIKSQRKRASDQEWSLMCSFLHHGDVPHMNSSLGSLEPFMAASQDSTRATNRIALQFVFLSLLTVFILFLDHLYLKTVVLLPHANQSKAFFIVCYFNLYGRS